MFLDITAANILLEVKKRLGEKKIRWAGGDMQNVFSKPHHILFKTTKIWSAYTNTQQQDCFNII